MLLHRYNAEGTKHNLCGAFTFSKRTENSPLGIPTIRNCIVKRAMLMAMEPIWGNNLIVYPMASARNAVSIMLFVQ